jgi:hypothetical protein
MGHGYRRLPGGLTSRGFTCSGFQPAMVRAHSRACVLSVTPGEQPAELDRGSELAALVEGGADGGGFSLSDDEHAGRMGVRIEGGKRTNHNGLPLGAGERDLLGAGGRTRLKAVFAGGRRCIANARNDQHDLAHRPAAGALADASRRLRRQGREGGAADRHRRVTARME